MDRISLAVYCFMTKAVRLFVYCMLEVVHTQNKFPLSRDQYHQIIVSSSNIVTGV